jgi:hypothetical protein
MTRRQSATDCYGGLGVFIQVGPICEAHPRRSWGQNMSSWTQAREAGPEELGPSQRHNDSKSWGYHRSSAWDGPYPIPQDSSSLWGTPDLRPLYWSTQAPSPPTPTPAHELDTLLLAAPVSLLGSRLALAVPLSMFPRRCSGSL